MKTILSCIAIICCTAVVAFSQTRILWPANNATNVTTAPVIKIRFNKPIDSSGIVWQYPPLLTSIDTVKDTTKHNPSPTFLLLPIIYRDSIPDSLWYAATYSYTAAKLDDSTIEVTTQTLHFSATYFFEMKGAKAIDTVGGGHDTVTLSTDTIVFTTTLPPHSISSTVFDTKGNTLNCSDTLSVQFSRPIYTSNPLSGPIVDILHISGNTPVDSNGDINLLYDTLSTNKWLSSDSSTLYILPTSGMVAGENYWMDVHLDRITGDPGRNFYKLFTIRNKSIITLGVAAQDTTDTLPDACHPIPDTGTYSFAIGDTFHVTAYDTIGDFAFVHWQCSGDSQYNNDTASSLNISYSCEQTRDLALTAIYKRMYRDTINFGSYEHAHPQIFADYVDSLSPTKYVVSGPHNSTFSIVMIPDSGYYVDSITEIPQGGSALTFMSYNITLPITNVPYNIDPYPHTGGGDVCTTYQVCTNAVIDNWDAGVDDYNNRGFTIPNPVLNNVVSITFTPPVNGSCAPNPPGQQPGWLTVNVNILPNYKTANSNWRISKIVISNSAGITNAYYYFQYPCTGPTQSCTLPVAANDCPTTLTVYVAPTRYYLFTEYTMTDGSQIPADVNINLDDMSSYRWFYDWNDHRCRLVTTTSDNNGTHVTRIWEEYCNDPVVLMPAFNSPESFSNWAAGQWTQTCPQPPTYMCPPVGWAQNGNYSVPTPNNTSPYIVTMTSNVHVKALFSAPLLLLDVGYTQGNNNSTITWYSVYPYNAVPSVVKNVTLEETNPITTTDVYFKFNKPVDQTTISNNISFNDISGIASVTGASIRLMDSHTLQSYPSTHVDLSGNSSSPAILKFKLYNSQNLGVVKYETFNSTLKNGLKSTVGDNLATPSGQSKYNFSSSTVYPNVDIYLDDYMIGAPYCPTYPNCWQPCPWGPYFVFINSVVFRRDGTAFGSPGSCTYDPNQNDYKMVRWPGQYGDSHCNTYDVVNSSNYNTVAMFCNSAQNENEEIYEWYNNCLQLYTSLTPMQDNTSIGLGMDINNHDDAVSLDHAYDELFNTVVYCQNNPTNDTRYYGGWDIGWFLSDWTEQYREVWESLWCTHWWCSYDLDLGYISAKYNENNNWGYYSDGGGVGEHTFEWNNNAHGHTLTYHVVLY